MDLSVLARETLVDELIGPAPDPLRAVSGGPPKDKRPGIATGSRDRHLSYVLQVARELLLRDLQREMQAKSVISSPAALRDWLRLYCAKLEHEVFLVLFLDSQHQVIDVDPMFRGTVAQCSVYPREVVKAALSRNAAAVAFAHNHPSGLAEPSRADEYLTETLKAALALVDVRVLDHFVIAGDQMVSLAERGML